MPYDVEFPLKDVGNDLTDDTASHSKRQQSS
jgi:hypothetical protein